jgi:hypothetical protein
LRPLQERESAQKKIKETLQQMKEALVVKNINEAPKINQVE